MYFFIANKKLKLKLKLNGVNIATEPCTWRMFLSFLIILMMTMVPEVITNVLDFTQGFQKYMTHGVNNAKEPSRISLYLGGCS